MAGFELVEKLDPEEFSLKAARQALSLLSAQPAPAGKFPVIFHPSVTGLLTHEAIGHNAEADSILAGESIIDGKLGEQIASDVVTIIDDATLPGYWGSYKYDSEGVPASRRVLIDRGKLVGYLHSMETAAKLGVKPNGSARADGYYSRPIVRMSNTFILPGDMTFEEMLRDIDLGIFLTGTSWGNTSWSSSGYDRLIRADWLSNPSDSVHRLVNYADAEHILLDELPVSPLLFPASVSLRAPHVQGMISIPTVPYLDLSQTWIVP
jgi:TldD protein